MAVALIEYKYCMEFTFSLGVIVGMCADFFLQIRVTKCYMKINKTSTQSNFLQYTCIL